MSSQTVSSSLFLVNPEAYSLSDPSSKFPNTPGVYAIFSYACVLYIGQTGNFRKRISRHIDEGKFHKSYTVRFLPLADYGARLGTERWLIEKHRPPRNKMHITGPEPGEWVYCKSDCQLEYWQENPQLSCSVDLPPDLSEREILAEIAFIGKHFPSLLPSFKVALALITGRAA